MEPLFVKVSEPIGVDKINYITSNWNVLVDQKDKLQSEFDLLQSKKAILDRAYELAIGQLLSELPNDHAFVIDLVIMTASEFFMAVAQLMIEKEQENVSIQS